LKEYSNMSTISSSLPQTNTAVATATPKTPVVAKSSNSDLALAAVSISAEASVVSTLSGTAGTGYDAVSLLSFLQQSTPTTSLPGATAGGASDPTTIDTTGSAAGSVADWSALLKQSPALAYTAATDNFNQAVLSTLKIVA
jgi:hypothetical protein